MKMLLLLPPLLSACVLFWAHGYVVGRGKRYLDDLRRTYWENNPDPTAFRVHLTDGRFYDVYADSFKREGDLIVFRSEVDDDSAFGPIVSAHDAENVVRVDMPGVNITPGQDGAQE